MSELHIDPANARVGHDTAGIAASLRTYGQRTPLVARVGGQILKGNGTYRAAEDLGWTHIAVIFVEDDPATAVGYALADNRLAEASRFDDAILARLLADLPPELPTGFDDTAVAAIVRDATTAVPQNAPETPHTAGEHKGPMPTAENAIAPQPAATAPAVVGDAPAVFPAVEEGDLFQIGRHWLLCGDCRQLESWQRLLDAAGVEHADGVFTSPPYAAQRANHYGGVPPSEFVNWFDEVQSLAAAYLRRDGSFFINIRAHTEEGTRALYVYDLVLAMVRLWDWQLIDDLVWVRQGFPGKFRNRFKNGWEPIYHFAQTAACVFRPENVVRELDPAGGSFTPYETGRDVTMQTDFAGETGRNVRAAGLDGALPSNVIQALTGVHDSPGVRYGAKFPVALAEFFLNAYSDPAAVWLDPFAGSGTVAEAAERTGRTALLIDLNPEACQVTFGRLARLGLEVMRC